MKGFVITETNKVDDGGSIQYIKRDLIPSHCCYDSDVVKHSIEARCRVVRGELHYNTDLGVVLNDDQEHLDLVVQDIILRTNGVRSIQQFSSSVDKTTRRYTASVSVNTIFNDTIEVVI